MLVSLLIAFFGKVSAERAPQSNLIGSGGSGVTRVEIFFTENDGVFVSNYNEETRTWSTPIQLPGSNTTDYQMVLPASNSLDQYGLTAKQCPQGQHSGDYIWTASPPVATSEWNSSCEPGSSRLKHDPQNYNWPRREPESMQCINESDKKGKKDKNEAVTLALPILSSVLLVAACCSL